MATKPDGSVSLPPRSATPGKSGAPASKSPGETKPQGTPSGSPLKVGPPGYLATTVSPASIFNKNGFVGVDPQYQNYANVSEQPLLLEVEEQRLLPDDDEETPGAEQQKADESENDESEKTAEAPKAAEAKSTSEKSN